MNCEINLEWYGPISFNEFPQRLREINNPGEDLIYFWIYNGTPKRIFYVGETNKGFFKRTTEHIAEHMSGNYNTFDPSFDLSSAKSEDFLEIIFSAPSCNPEGRYYDKDTDKQHGYRYNFKGKTKPNIYDNDLTIINKSIFVFAKITDSKIDKSIKDAPRELCEKVYTLHIRKEYSVLGKISHDDLFFLN